MARMISFAGELEIKFLKAQAEGDQLVIEAELGVWDSQIFFQPQDMVELLRLLLNRSVIAYILLFPFKYVRQRFRR